MNKQEFLKALDKKLKNLPREEREKSLAFYSEIIDDKTEEGASEKEAVESLGSPDKIAREILSDASFGSLVKGGADRMKNKCDGNPLFILLLVLGFPIWFPLLVVAAALLFSGSIVILSLLIALFAVQFAALVSGAACAIQAIACFLTSAPAFGVFALGAGLTLVAAFFLLWKPLGKLEKALLGLSGLWLKGIKRLFVNKRED